MQSCLHTLLPMALRTPTGTPTQQQPPSHCHELPSLVLFRPPLFTFRPPSSSARPPSPACCPRGPQHTLLLRAAARGWQLASPLFPALPLHAHRSSYHPSPACCVLLPSPRPRCWTRAASWTSAWTGLLCVRRCKHGRVGARHYMAPGGAASLSAAECSVKQSKVRRAGARSS